MSRIITCTGCRRQRPHKSRKRCSSCYSRLYQPLVGNPGGRGVSKTRAVVAGRLEDIAELLARGEDRRMIAERLGVSVRTISRYRVRLRQEAA